MKHLFPDAVFDQHIIALGKTGAGKSSAVRLIVEHLLDSRQRVIVVTPKADWWGLKLAADGKHAGYPVPVFGSEHADMPLHHLSGKTIAELLGTGDRSAILQMRDFMPSERTAFWIDFASTLFRVLRGKLFLVIDEVHNFAPKGKSLDVKAAQMLHWSNKLASEARGLGITLIGASQRAAKVHNDFLTSCETLIAMRVTTSWDREAIEAWISGCGDEKAGDEVLRTLAQMKRGDAWVWSPEAEFGPKQIHFPMFATYDSFRPQTASDVKGLKGWADVDLDEVKKKLEFVVKEAESNDPAKLKLRIAELQRELRVQKTAKTPIKRDPSVDARAIERAVREAAAPLLAAARAHETIIKRQAKVLADIAMLAAKAANVELPKIDPLKIAAQTSGEEIQRKEGLPVPKTIHTQRKIDPRPIIPSNGSHGESESLTPYQIDILRGLAELESIGKSDVPFALAGVAARKSAASSTFERYRSRLQSAGLVSYPRPGRLALTEEGRKIAPSPEAPLSSDEIQKRCISLLTPYQADLVNALISVHPKTVTREELGELASKQSSSSTFEGYVASLRSMEIIEYTAAKTVKAADWLFLQ